LVLQEAVTWVGSPAMAKVMGARKVPWFEAAMESMAVLPRTMARELTEEVKARAGVMVTVRAAAWVAL